MVLRLKAWESRSPPGLPSGRHAARTNTVSARSRPAPQRRALSLPAAGPNGSKRKHRGRPKGPRAETPRQAQRAASGNTAAGPKGRERKQIYPGAGWSSPVARQAHNLKVGGSNPPPATNFTCDNPSGESREGFLLSEQRLRMPARSPRSSTFISPFTGTRTIPSIRERMSSNASARVSSLFRASVRSATLRR